MLSDKLEETENSKTCFAFKALRRKWIRRFESVNPPKIILVTKRKIWLDKLWFIYISINFPSENNFFAGKKHSIFSSHYIATLFWLILYFCREGRYLLIMTENFAALPRVKQILLEEDSEEPYVIFGSGFPKDQLFTQVKICFLRIYCYDDSLPIYLSGSLCACLSVCLYISLCYVLDCPFVRLFIYSFLRHINYGSDIFLICNFKIYRFVAISTVSRSVWRPAEQ